MVGVEEILRVVMDHGIWGLVTLLVVMAARSRPARELSRVVSKEIRWRYLHAKGYSDEQLRKNLLDDWDDDQKTKALEPPPDSTP